MAETLEEIRERAKHPCFLDENSRPFDVHRKADHPEVDEAVEHVLSVMGVTPPRQKTYHDAFLHNLKALILDLYVAYLQGPHMWVGIPMKKANQHKARFRALHLSGETIAKHVKSVHGKGLIEMVMGYWDYSTRAGKQTRIQATDRLFEILLEYDINEVMLDRHERPEIVLREKDEKGKRLDIDITDDQWAETLRYPIRQFNILIAQARITLGIDLADQLRLRKRMKWRPGFRLEMLGTQYRRVFNRVDGQDFLFGGRLYGHWSQNIPKECRPDICINGEKTLELDYGRLHPSLAYDLAGMPKPDGGLYTWPGCKTGDEERLIRKVLFNCLLNANSQDEGVGGAMGCLQDKHGLDVSWGYVKSLCEPLMKHHAAIADYFGTGLGRKLQFIDSEIALGILFDLAAEGIVALPIHDSFIVQKHHEDRLRGLMEYHYCSRMGSRPVIKRSGD